VSGKTTIDKQRADLRVARDSIGVMREAVEAEHAKVSEDRDDAPVPVDAVLRLWRQPPPETS
jgi:hypothetical protein